MPRPPGLGGLKAKLAQSLLQRAWSRTLAGETAVTPWPWADTWPVARLMVPSKKIDLIVLNGAYGRTLAFGPGYVESSTWPSSVGTTIFTGHRDTHFGFLKRLNRHDEIVIETATGKKLCCVVSERRIVDAQSGTTTLDPSQPRLVLVTCYPFDAMIPGGPLRYVVVAEERWRTRLRPVEHLERSCSNRFALSLSKNAGLQTGPSCVNTLTAHVAQNDLSNTYLKIGFRKDLFFVCQTGGVPSETRGRLLDRWK